MTDLDAINARWKAAGPLSKESMRCLPELRKAAMTDQPQDLLWARFVRSLSDEQCAAALGEAFRLF